MSESILMHNFLSHIATYIS